MAANYLHGFETIEKKGGPRAIRVVKSGVIALIGTAPAGPRNVLTQCLSDRDAAQFGPDLPGHTIPAAFKGVYDQGFGTVLAINVLDPGKHKSRSTGEVHTFGNDDRLKLYSTPILGLPRVTSWPDGGKTFTANSDFYVNQESGEIFRIRSGSIPAGAAVSFEYDYVDPSQVTVADVIGGVDLAGRRTGIQMLDDAYNLFGYFPKILIAPGFSTIQAVSTELIAAAEKYGANALIDAPIGVTPAQAIAGRGPLGTINFNTGSERAILCYPHLQVYDKATGATKLEPMSVRLAGVMAAKDLKHGYWWSPSNTEIKGIVGLERPLTARLDDPQSEVNALNEAGIVTVFNSFGTGFLTWGNRNAAWPTDTAMTSFINVRRTKDMIDESIRYSSLPFADRPVTQALIDDMVESVNQFIRKLIGDDALIGGECWFSPARNPTTELQLGHVTFSYKITVPLPFERGTFESELTGEYLATFKGGN